MKLNSALNNKFFLQKLNFSNSSLCLLFCAVYIILPTIYVYQILGKPLVGTDDANILFVYARNFAQGNGIVYNIGGEHIEGFSCPLYFFICSLFYLFTNSPEQYLFVFNIAVSVCTCYLLLSVLLNHVLFSIEKRTTKIVFLFLFLIWLLINPAYYVWNIISLMDNGIYCFVLTLLFYQLIKISKEEDEILKNKFVFPCLIILLILVRPEGIAWVMALLSIHICFVYFKSKNLFETIREVKAELFTFLISIIILVLFRIYYFGYPLPNTYYTKVSSSFVSTISDGCLYFISFIKTYGFWFLIPLAGLFISNKSINENKYFQFNSVATILFIFVLVALTIPILEGGDHFKLFRFYQAVYPFLVFPLLYLLKTIVINDNRKQIVFGILLVIFVFSFSNFYGWNNFIKNNEDLQTLENVNFCVKNDFEIAVNSRNNGDLLNIVFKNNLPRIGYGSAGGIKYTYRGIVYDMMGLNNTLMAHANGFKSGPKGHQSFCADIFYRLSPDILMPSAMRITQLPQLNKIEEYYTNVNSWDNQIFKNIFNDTKFKNIYALATIENKSIPELACCGYFNKLYLQQLSESKLFKVNRFLSSP